MVTLSGLLTNEASSDSNRIMKVSLSSNISSLLAVMVIVVLSTPRSKRALCGVITKSFTGVWKGKSGWEGGREEENKSDTDVQTRTQRQRERERVCVSEYRYG